MATQHTATYGLFLSPEMTKTHWITAIHTTLHV